MTMHRSAHSLKLYFSPPPGLPSVAVLRYILFCQHYLLV